MAEKKWITIVHFIIWLLIVPPGMIYLLANQMPDEINVSYLILFVIFGVLTVLFPIKLNGEPVTLVMWVTLPAFLMYGLAVELVVMQLAIVATLFAVKSKVNIFQRFFFNSIMLFFLSVVSALAFYFVGGKIGSMQFWYVLMSAAVFRLIYTTTNIGLLKAYFQMRGLKNPLTIKDIAHEYASIILILPLALTFYFLLNLVGISSFLLLGFPFFVTITIIRLYGRSEKVNDSIKRA